MYYIILKEYPAPPLCYIIQRLESSKISGFLIKCEMKIHIYPFKPETLVNFFWKNKYNQQKNLPFHLIQAPKYMAGYPSKKQTWNYLFKILINGKKVEGNTITTTTVLWGCTIHWFLPIQNGNRSILSMFRNISKAEKQEFESEFLDEVVEEEDLELEFITVKECMQSVHVLYYTLTTKVCNNKMKALLWGLE